MFSIYGIQVLCLLVGEHERGVDVGLADEEVEGHVVVELQVVQHDGVIFSRVSPKPEH